MKAFVNNKYVDPIPFLYVLSLAIAFTTRYGDVEIGYKHQLVIGAFWIFFILIKLIQNKFLFQYSARFNSSVFLKSVKLYIFPHIILHLYTVFLMFIGVVSWSNFTSNLTVYVPTLLAIFSLYFFKNRSLHYFFYSYLLSWGMSVCISLFTKGPLIFVQAIYQTYINSEGSVCGIQANYFELHDLVLASGYIVIYYFWKKRKLTINNLIFISFVILIFFLGMKRVALLGILLFFIFKLCLDKFIKNNSFKFCIFIGWLGIFFCYFYVFIFSIGDDFFNLLNNFGINPMGRNYYYGAVLAYSSFSIDFYGIGRNVVTYLLNNELSYLRVGGVHSDVIKMYVENGFILFGFWLWYYLVFITKFYKRNFGTTCSSYYFSFNK